MTGSVNGLIDDLRAIVGDRGLLLGDDVRGRSCDPFRSVPTEGLAIVRPTSTAQVSAVMRLCQARGQRIVTHGGRTGVAGGAYVDVDEIVLSLERMNAIEEIDPIGQTVVVQAGMTLQGLQEAVAEHGLFYAIDLGAKGSASIGGTIATNAGGNRVLRWGMTRSNVLGLEAVLADGTIVSLMNRLVKNNTGYDLKHLLIGSEGTLGIVTRAVLRLVPMPTTQQVAFLSLPTFDAVLELLARARRLPTLSAFEVMWQDFYRIVARDPARAPLPADAPYYVLVETMGYDDAIDPPQFATLLERAYDAGLIVDAVQATSARLAADLWSVREGSDMIVREMSPFVSFDVSIESRRAEAFIDAARHAVAGGFASARTVAFGHLGDNNLHLGVHVGADTIARTAEIERCVYRIVKSFDGALTAEHGIGRFKRDYLPHHVSEGALAMMRTVRGALDPASTLNRGVLF